MTVVAISEIEAAEAAIIHLAERAGIDRRSIQRALKLSRRTYYRRRRLPGEIVARTETEKQDRESDDM
jgi:hypothetical protein